MSTDLVDLLEDIEHVMLGFGTPTATATPGATGVLTAARRSERALSLLGENPPEMVGAHLTDHGFIEYFDALEERVGPEADPMNPSSDPLTRALIAYASRHGVSLEQARRTSVFIGDDAAHVRAAGAAGVACIAYAQEPGDRHRFEDSGAAAVISTMDELAQALNARWDAQWCARQGCC